MPRCRVAAVWFPLLSACLLAACASRPINPPIEHYDSNYGYRFGNKPVRGAASDTLVILAFSGGGTRAAAFSFGVLEELRRTEIVLGGSKSRLLDEVDIITGVSGGSFTALAYGLYGDRLFDEYEARFLKRNVQGELIARFLSPRNWAALWSASFGRSEVAAELYDEILFEHATFGDLQKKGGPVIMTTATDLSSGSRLAFTQSDFDLLCSDLSAVPLSRAAAASSAVPLALSPVTLNNYGGTCAYRWPRWVKAISDPANRMRPAGRTVQRYTEMQSFQDSADRPYIHLVDGGVSDNLGMRGVLEGLEEIESSPAYRKAVFKGVNRIAVFVVNSLSVPKTNWDKSERPPSDLLVLLKATGVPIDRYSYEAIELLKDLIARWNTLHALEASTAFANAGNMRLARAVDVPDIDVYAIDVSFAADSDPVEQEYLNNLPTSFVLPDEAVDQLRSAAGRVIRESSEFQRLLHDVGATVVAPAVQP